MNKNLYVMFLLLFWMRQENIFFFINMNIKIRLNFSSKNKLKFNLEPRI